MNYSDIYFSVLSVATIAVAGLMILCLFYIIAILSDIKRLSKIARREAEFVANSIAKGASLLGTELSSEAAGFVRTIFTLLVSQFSGSKSRKAKKAKVREA